MATVPALAYVPVALVTRLSDGQLVVLHGQSAAVETSMDLDRRTDGYTTTVEWQPGKMAQTRLPGYCPGVKLHDDNGIGGPLFHPEPLTGQDENAELRARIAQARGRRPGHVRRLRARAAHRLRRDRDRDRAQRVPRSARRQRHTVIGMSCTCDRDGWPCDECKDKF